MNRFWSAVCTAHAPHQTVRVMEQCMHYVTQKYCKFIETASRSIEQIENHVINYDYKIAASYKILKIGMQDERITSYITLTPIHANYSSI